MKPEFELSACIFCGAKTPEEVEAMCNDSCYWTFDPDQHEINSPEDIIL